MQRIMIKARARNHVIRSILNLCKTIIFCLSGLLLLAGCTSGPEFLNWDYGNVIRKTPYVVSADGTITWWELTDGGCPELTDNGCLKFWVFHGDRPGTKKDKFAAYGYRNPPDKPPVKLLEISDGVAGEIAESIAGIRR
jgi:hypothetical protein